MLSGRAVEYLSTLRKSSGGTLVGHEATQVLIPICPPNTLITISAGPIGSDYGQIVWGVRFGMNMVPNAFMGWLQIWGTRQITGTFTVAVLNTEFQGFGWVTQAEPAVIYCRNVSAMNQVFELDWLSLRIASEDDFKEVLDHLRHLATSAKSEQLAEEGNSLLKIMAGVP